jgi:hypothetical protein
MDQDRHQHDRRAGADDAGEGAGDKPDRKHEEEIQRARLPRIPPGAEVAMLFTVNYEAIHRQL